VKVVFDLHHHRCNPARGLEAVADAVAAACETWPAAVRPEAYLSSLRTEFRTTEHRRNGSRAGAM
jgi:UV DNA damage repair endonuclease